MIIVLMNYEMYLFLIKGKIGEFSKEEEINSYC